VNSQRCPVLALDVPSGIQSDTGQVLGCAVRATHTITFIALKPGLLTLDGRITAARSGWRGSISICRAPGRTRVADRTLFQGALVPAAQLPQGNAGSLASWRRARDDRRGAARAARR
jgi:hypothetical protein